MRDANQQSGRVVLYINQVDSRTATPERVGEWARFARSLGADSISPKVGEGNDMWFAYADVGRFRAAALAEGCGYIPFWYSLANEDIEEEARQLLALQAANDHAGISIDMEDTWNGQDARARAYAAALTPAYAAGPIYISTWADPAQQNWDGVIAALSPVVDCFCPQEYSNWLAWAATQEWHLSPDRLQPQIDLTQGEFGAENAVSIALAARAQGHRAIWLWEDAAAAKNPALARQVVAAFNDSAPPPPPAPAAPRRYVVRPGDTLSGIARHFYGNAALWPRIFAANRGLVIDPDSIQIGWDLVIP
jgi:LysM repeat protein